VRTNSSGVTEVASIRTNMDTYGENHDHVFNKDKCKCEECEKLKESNQNNSHSRPS
jgi:hypothetical protein